MPKEAYLCDPSSLTEEMKRGDIDALDRLTRCYGERLMAVGRRHCRDEADAQDAVQDALLAAGRHMTGFRGDGSPEGWLVRLVTNACRRMSRGRKNDPSLHEDVEARPLSTRDAGPEELARRGELMQALGEALVALSPVDRAVLLLAEAEDWRAPEIAEALDLSPAAVRKRLSRVRAKLRPQLEEWVA